MPRPAFDSARLRLLLQARGPQPSRALLAALRTSPATLTRAVAQASPAIERLGAARSTRYALRRPVRHFGSAWPVYGLDRAARPSVLGELRALHGGFRFLPTDAAIQTWYEPLYPDGVSSGLPFFLQDLRPQGYLGRALAQALSSQLGVPPDPRLWQDDDVLAFLLTSGHDGPGDLLLGDRALEQALRAAEAPASDAIDEADCARRYPERAALAAQGVVAGSSAAGEQPKFLATVRRRDGSLRSVLVKFSAATPSPVSERWADLLRAEHLAADTLRTAGIPAAATRLLEAGGRCFLEVERFDRVEARGRCGLLSLEAVEEGLTGTHAPDWVAAATALLSARWLSPSAARTLRWLWCFGDLIANNDMHRANASLAWAHPPPCALAPSYDMLPMAFAPGPQGELVERSYAPRPPWPAVADVWSEAAVAAERYWQAAATAPHFSSAWRALAARQADVVTRQRQRYG